MDHKEKVEVAIKINRNSTWDHSSSRTEITILRKLKNGYYDTEGGPNPEGEDDINQYRNRVVEFRDSFFFRNHYCIIFEVLGKNLLTDLKEQSFDQSAER